MDADVACGNVAATRQRTGLSVRAGQSLAPRKLMNARDYLNDDGHVLLALCSAFGLPDNAEAEGLTPFKLAEWNQLSRKIAASSLKQPAARGERTALRWMARWPQAESHSARWPTASKRRCANLTCASFCSMNGSRSSRLTRPRPVFPSARQWDSTK